MTFSSASTPFVGLRPFESDESLLFFGRQEQIMELLQRLHQRHFVSVVGSSGSGKSSLVKAGLIPRLKAGFLVNDQDKWIIATMKPGESPVGNLAEAVNQALDSVDNQLSSPELESEINEEGAEAVTEVLQPLLETRHNFMLLVDQFEELFRFSIRQNDPARIDEAIHFVNVLLELSSGSDFPVYVVITMRSDFIGDCSFFFGLPEVLSNSQYLVPRLNRVQLRQSIEGPVSLFQGRIDAGLTVRLLNDTQQLQDELPLLQHLLMRMWDKRKSPEINRELNLEDYDNVGGIEKALSNHADEGLKDMSETDLHLTKKIFQQLTGVDQNGRKIRQPVHLSEIQLLTGAGNEKLHFILHRFIEDNRNFLVINKVENRNDELIDISHESLIRQWNTLSTWVDEEAEAAKTYLRLSEGCKLYQERKKDFLQGNELQQILEWYNIFKPVKKWAFRYNPDFDINIRYLLDSDKEERKQHARRARNRRLFIAGLCLVIVVISLFALQVYKNDVKNRESLAINYWKNSHIQRAKGNALGTLFFLANAAVTTHDDELVKNLLLDAEVDMPLVQLSNIFLEKNIANTAVFSGDGKQILVAGNDGAARILDAITGRQIGSTMELQSPVNSAVFSVGDSLVLTTGNDRKASIWNAKSGTQILSFEHPGQVTSGVFSPDTKWILTGCTDGNARIWDVGTGELIYSFEHSNEVKSVSFSPDAKFILTACGDNAPHIWDLAKRSEIKFPNPPFEPVETNISYADFNKDGSKLLTISGDSTVRIWSATGILLAGYRHPDKIVSAAFSADDNWLLTGCQDQFARIWNIRTMMQAGTEMKHEGPVQGVTFDETGSKIMTTGWDKTVRVWNFDPSGHNTRMAELRQKGIVSLSTFSPDGTKILTAGYDSTANVWSTYSKKKTWFVKDNGKVTAAAFSSDGSQVVTASDDSTISIWHSSDGKKQFSVKLDSRITSASFSSDDNLLLAATTDNDLRVWDTKAKSIGKLVHSYKFPFEINKAVFSKDNSKVLLSAGDSSAHLITLATGSDILRLLHNDIVTTAVFSPDEKEILTASFDGTARIWNAITGVQTGPSLKHSSYVSGATYSSDGKWIITVGWDKQAHLWNRKLFEEMGVPPVAISPVITGSLSPDNKLLLVSGYDSTAKLLEIGTDLDLPPILLMLQTQALSGARLNVETNEVECIPETDWIKLKDDYNTQAAKHFKECRYQVYNEWNRFNR